MDDTWVTIKTQEEEAFSEHINSLENMIKFTRKDAMLGLSCVAGRGQSLNIETWSSNQLAFFIDESSLNVTPTYTHTEGQRLRWPSPRRNDPTRGQTLGTPHQMFNLKKSFRWEGKRLQTSCELLRQPRPGWLRTCTNIKDAYDKSAAPPLANWWQQYTTGQPHGSVTL